MMDVLIEYKIRVASGRIVLSEEELLAAGSAEKAIQDYLGDVGVDIKKNPVPGERNFYIVNVKAEPPNE